MDNYATFQWYMSKKCRNHLTRMVGMGNDRMQKYPLHQAKYRMSGFVVTLLMVEATSLPVPFVFVGYDLGELINFEFLVLVRMRIVKSPLLKWDVSADKVLLYTRHYSARCFELF